MLSGVAESCSYLKWSSCLKQRACAPIIGTGSRGCSARPYRARWSDSHHGDELSSTSFLFKTSTLLSCFQYEAIAIIVMECCRVQHPSYLSLCFIRFSFACISILNYTSCEKNWLAQLQTACHLSCVELILYILGLSGSMKRNNCLKMLLKFFPSYISNLNLFRWKFYTDHFPSFLSVPFVHCNLCNFLVWSYRVNWNCLSGMLYPTGWLDSKSDEQCPGKASRHSRHRI